MAKEHAYQFCFGPWNLSEGSDPYGPTTRPAQTFDWKLAQLKKHGFEASFHESPGAHTWINWRNYLNEFATQLF